MIDFNNAIFNDMKIVDNDTFRTLIQSFLVDGEIIIISFQNWRDGIVFTNKRIITINIQQMSGQRKDITSLPYKKVDAFAFQTCGSGSDFCLLELWYTGAGKISLMFRGDTDIAYLCSIVSDGAL